MKRKILMGLLAVGALAGFASGFSHLRHGYGIGGHHHARAEHAAEVCVDAALAEVRGEARPPRVDHTDRWIVELCADEARRRR